MGPFPVGSCAGALGFPAGGTKVGLVVDGARLVVGVVSSGGGEEGGTSVVVVSTTEVATEVVSLGAVVGASVGVGEVVETSVPGVSCADAGAKWLSSIANRIPSTANHLGDLMTALPS